MKPVCVAAVTADLADVAAVALLQLLGERCSSSSVEETRAKADVENGNVSAEEPATNDLYLPAARVELNKKNRNWKFAAGSRFPFAFPQKWTQCSPEKKTGRGLAGRILKRDCGTLFMPHSAFLIGAHY